MIPLQPSGRSGLDKIDVTPAVFLQLRAQLSAGRKVPFSEPQLLIAFSRYLHNHKGRWTRDEIKGTRGLHKFAEDYVTRETRRLEKTLGKTPTSKKSASAKQQKAEKFIEQHGLKLLGQKEIPQTQGMNLKSSSVTSKDTIKHSVDASEIAVELLSIARAADPSIAVAAVLLSRTLLPNMSSMAIDSTYILLEKFENRSKTAQEKDIVLHGLEVVTANLAPTLFNQDIARIQDKEKSNPHAQPEHLKRMEILRGTSDPQAEIIAKQELHDTQNTQENLSITELYKNNIQAMDIQYPRAENHVQDTLSATSADPSLANHSLSRGPKPPTDEIFGTRKNDHD